MSQKPKHYPRRDLAQFLERATEIHGNKIDFSQVTEEGVKDRMNKVPLKCNICSHQWEATVSNIVYNKAGCLPCTKIARLTGENPAKKRKKATGERKYKPRWTLERFMKEAYEIHGNKIDFTAVTADHIKNNVSNVPVVCTTCHHEWTPTIASLIYSKCGCVVCHKGADWTFERFIAKAEEMFGGVYDFSLVKPEHVQGKESKVPVLCKKCGVTWTPTIGNLIVSDPKSLTCAKHNPWNYDRVMKSQKPGFDYSLVKPEHIQNAVSKIPLRCARCNHKWDVDINSHFNQRDAGCPSCSGHLPWTYERVLACGRHDEFDYSLVTPEHVVNCDSKIPVRCIKCNQVWYQAIDYHFGKQYGCICSKTSKGERLCYNFLTSLGIQVSEQYAIQELPRKRYDLFFVYNGKPILLEFDGSQHFRDEKYFNHDERTSLENRQKMDILKTTEAISAGYYIIRIDFTQLNYIPYHILDALRNLDDETPYFFSRPEMYDYIMCQI